MVNKASGPLDLTHGVPLADLQEGQRLTGTIGDTAVLLLRNDGVIHALGARCTHLGAPMAQGLVRDGHLRCPWHQACFRLRDGAVLEAPALEPLPTYAVSVREGRIYVGARQPVPVPPRPRRQPASVSIVGGGAAAHAAVVSLQAAGYAGPLHLFTAESHLPYDRTRLSKDCLKGRLPPAAELMLPPATAYAGVDVRLGTRVERVSASPRTLHLAGGGIHAYDSLILATGGAPRRPALPGIDLAHVHTLRSYDDVVRLQDALGGSPRVVVLGGGFIGLEVAAALRGRGCPVTLVDPAEVPIARSLGRTLGTWLMDLHRAQGVSFCLGRLASRIEADAVYLDDGTRLAAELVVVGMGVVPNTGLVADLGWDLDQGIPVDAGFATPLADVYAVGDVAAVAGADGAHLRIEHWTLAQRQAQALTQIILGAPTPAPIVPFFWSNHYDVKLRYVGHASNWEQERCLGDLTKGRAAIVFESGGLPQAVATLGCDGLAMACAEALAAGGPQALQAALQSGAAGLAPA